MMIYFAVEKRNFCYDKAYLQQLLRTIRSMNTKFVQQLNLNEKKMNQLKKVVVIHRGEV